MKRRFYLQSTVSALTQLAVQRGQAELRALTERRLTTVLSLSAVICASPTLSSLMRVQPDVGTRLLATQHVYS